MSQEQTEIKANEEFEKALKLFNRFLRENNLKVTRERRLILKELTYASTHLDAEELLLRLRKRGEKVSRATIYRTFDLLTRASLISKSDFGHNHFHYEKSIGSERHDHMICSDSGEVIEFKDDRLDSLLKEICDDNGFEMQHRSLQVFGRIKK